MLTIRIVAATLWAGLIALSAGTVSGQGYPNKPVRILTAGGGGAADIFARAIAQAISGPLGQPVIVENRASLLVIEIGAKAQPDGYTLVIAGSQLWLLPLMQDNVPSEKSFSPISLLSSSPNILVVQPSLPVKSVNELIALAKAKPGALNYSSSAAGGSSHLSGELFKYMAGVKIARIPYKNTPPAIIAVTAGEAQMMFASVGTATPHIKSGKVRALAVTSAQPSALSPDLPTVAASGLPSYESVAFTAVFAPARTPVAVIRRLNQEIVRVIYRADVKEIFLNLGTDPVGGSPEQFAAVIKQDIARMGKVIKEAGIRAE